MGLGTPVFGKSEATPLLVIAQCRYRFKHILPQAWVAILSPIGPIHCDLDPLCLRQHEGLGAIGLNLGVVIGLNGIIYSPSCGRLHARVEIRCAVGKVAIGCVVKSLEEGQVYIIRTRGGLGVASRYRLS